MKHRCFIIKKSCKRKLKIFFIKICKKKTCIRGKIKKFHLSKFLAE